jgi:predicted metal-dependent peptidase
VVIVDVSGSIDDPLMDRFARELEAITRRLEARLIIIIGDDQVRRVDCFAPGRSNLRELVFNGGGGTDFDPLLKEADTWRPDMGLFLTDLQGPALYRPAWPVLWAVSAEWAAAEPPFGRKLVLR